MPSSPFFTSLQRELTTWIDLFIFSLTSFNLHLGFSKLERESVCVLREMMHTPYNTSTQGQYCHYCAMFHHHSQSCCYNNNNSNAGVYEQNGEDYYSSSVVDCTLSLGTPSTRLCEEDENRRRTTSYGPSSCISNFWDLIHTKNNHSNTKPSFDFPSFSTGNPIKPTRGCPSGNGGGDSLLARRCANCDTTSTPLWRNGPRGPKVINFQ